MFCMRTYCEAYQTFIFQTWPPNRWQKLRKYIYYKNLKYANKLYIINIICEVYILYIIHWYKRNSFLINVDIDWLIPLNEGGWINHYR